MRKINTGDAFKAARLIKHSGLKDLFLELYTTKAMDEATDKEKELATKRMGIDFVFSLLDALAEAKVEKSFYELIEGITEKQNIEEQPIEETIEDLQIIWKENDMKSFFTSVLRLVGMSST